MKNKVGVMEANLFVVKHKNNIFQQDQINYESMLDKQTLMEHKRQMARIFNSNTSQKHINLTEPIA